MKEISGSTNPYRISFNYLKAPSEKQSLYNSQKPQVHNLSFVELGGKKNKNQDHKPHDTSFKAHRYVNSEEQTLKK